jgi:subtilisin family serine protease
MRVRTFLVALGLLALLAAPVLDASASAADRYIILFNKNEIPSNASAVVEAAGGEIVRTLPQVGIAVAVSEISTFAGNLAGVAGVQSIGAAGANALPDVLEGPTPADVYYNAGEVWGVDRVHAPAAWAAGYTGSHDTVVAVIDTGIAWNHPDLAPNVIFTTCIAAAPGCNPYPSLSYHGTHVAGTVAAAFDGGRVVGVGPNLALASYNTFEDIPGCGVCTYSDTRWAAMIDAADQGFDVINMSLGGYGVYGGQGTNDLATYVAAEKRVANYVNQNGTTIVASAGNGGVDLNGNLIHTPGDIPQIINTAATGLQPSPRYPTPGGYDILAFYSNYGAPVTVAAPGGDCGEPFDCTGNTTDPDYAYYEYFVLSTYVVPDPTCAETYSCPVGYAWVAGTSMASPHVSGVAGLIKDANPKLSPQQVRSIIKSTAEDLGDRQSFGHGMVDAAAAVAKAGK